MASHLAPLSPMSHSDDLLDFAADADEFEQLFGLFSDPTFDPSFTSPSIGSLPIGESMLSSDSAASLCHMSSSAAPYVACNNKSALDAKWAHLNSLSTAELNRYLRVHTELTADDVLAIKQARRRAKSRVYSKTARDKRIHRDCDSMSSASDLCHMLPHDVQELKAAQAELQAARRQVDMLVRVLRSKGITIPADL